MTTIVHILGCHLQAERLNGDDWEKIVWGNGTLAGRLVQGLVTSYQAVQASNGEEIFISFGTGASMRNGVKESQFTLNFAFNKFRDLDLRLPGFDVEIEHLLSEALVDDETQNTGEEVRHVFGHATLKYVDEVVFVTSAFHASRALGEIVKAYRDMYPEEGKLRGPRFSIVPSRDDPGATLVMEEPHRGDLIQENFAPVLRSVFKFLKHPKLSQSIREGFEEVIEEHEQRL